MGHKVVSMNLEMNTNGPVVWGVAVCVEVGMSFCKVPVSGQDFRVTLKLSRWYQVPIDGQDLSRHDKTV